MCQNTRYAALYLTTSTHLYLTDSFIIMGTTTPLYITVPPSWGSLFTSAWQFHHLGYNYPPVPGWSSILKTTNHLYLTVPSLQWPLPTSTWLFYIPGDHYTTHVVLTVQSSWRPLPTSTWLLHHPGDQIIIFLGTTTLPTSSWQFSHHGDHYPPLPDCSMMLGTITKVKR